MSQIKIFKENKGYSLMEMIVVISLLGVVGVIVSGFLISTMKANSKAEITKEVRQNGDYVLSVLQGAILNSLSVSCTNPSANIKIIRVTDLNNQITDYTCNITEKKISSGSARLTGTNIAVTNCIFSCNTTSGRPTKVTIDFTIGNKSSTNLRPEEKSSVNFKSEVITRNY
ncbi:type II secretion system GspH family protein [Patescibacteria group bacterium]|nr:type II secretion system GspH family protein [Patescibacteria group bacterium]